MTKTSGSMTAVRRLRPFAIALLAAALGACAIGERIDEASKIDYKSATKGPSLDVPPDLAAKARLLDAPEGHFGEAVHPGVGPDRPGLRPSRKGQTGVDILAPHARAQAVRQT